MTQGPRKIAIMATPGRPDVVAEAGNRVEEKAAASGVELGSLDDDDLDLVVVLGGDGTMLRALRATLGTGTPVFGINFGRVGFLTTADGDDKECVQDCTLREAVVLAGSADRVLLPNGNYVLTGGELSLNGDTIIGEDPRRTFIDGGDKSRVLRVIEVVARVSNVTIRNGNGVSVVASGAGGGIYVDSGTLLLQNSTVSGNAVPGVSATPFSPKLLTFAVP